MKKYFLIAIATVMASLGHTNPLAQKKTKTAAQQSAAKLQFKGFNVLKVNKAGQIVSAARIENVSDKAVEENKDASLRSLSAAVVAAEAGRATGKAAPKVSFEGKMVAAAQTEASTNPSAERSGAVPAHYWGSYNYGNYSYYYYPVGYSYGCGYVPYYSRSWCYTPSYYTYSRSCYFGGYWGSIGWC